MRSRLFPEKKERTQTWVLVTKRCQRLHRRHNKSEYRNTILLKLERRYKAQNGLIILLNMFQKCQATVFTSTY